MSRLMRTISSVNAHSRKGESKNAIATTAIPQEILCAKVETEIPIVPERLHTIQKSARYKKPTESGSTPSRKKITARSLKCVRKCENATMVDTSQDLSSPRARRNGQNRKNERMPRRTKPLASGYPRSKKNAPAKNICTKKKRMNTLKS